MKNNAGDLLLIADSIHALLTTIPGVARLVWFFQGWDIKIPGARTPAELPWHADAPEQLTFGHSEGDSMIPRVLVAIARRPLLVGWLGRLVLAVLMVTRGFGAIVAAVGVLLALRVLAALTYGESLSNLWLTGAVGVTCVVAGVGMYFRPGAVRWVRSLP